MNLDQPDLFAEAVDREPVAPEPANRTVFAVLDLETTGLSPHDDQIIEAGAVRFDWGTSLDTLDAADRLDTLVNPGIPVPPDVTAPTGITDADVVDAPPIAQVTSGIREHWTSTGPTGASDGPGPSRHPWPGPGNTGLGQPERSPRAGGRTRSRRHRCRRVPCGSNPHGRNRQAACLIEPERYVDRQRLETWLAGRLSSTHPASQGLRRVQDAGEAPGLDDPH